jgi:uncharacterized protein (DUF1684 family)
MFMRFAGVALVALALTASTAGAAPTAATAVKLSPAARDSITKLITDGRAATEEWLKGKPTSYLATVQRKDFGGKAFLTVGRSAENDVRIDAEGIEPRHLMVTVLGDQFRVAALAPEASFQVGDTTQRMATLPPSSIKVGRFTIRLSHQRYPALIVFDPESPRFKLYKGLSYYPVDLAYRFELPLTPNPAADTVVILSTRGNQRRAVKVGWFDFKLGGKAQRLEATRLLEPGVGEKDFGIFFTDATTGKETYEVGRYLDLERLDDGRYVLDFNNAYNPACAFSDHYNCPIPPKANRLAVAIKAGEKDSHYMEH